MQFPPGGVFTSISAGGGVGSWPKGGFPGRACLGGQAQIKGGIVLDKENKKRIYFGERGGAINGHFSHSSCDTSDAPTSSEACEADQSHLIPHSRSPRHT